MPNPPAVPGLHMTDYLISRLTSPRSINTEEELLSFCHGAGFYPEGDHYAVLVVHVERWSTLLLESEQHDETIKHHFFILTNMLQELMGKYGLSVTAEKDYEMVCILNLQQPWEGFCKELRESLETMLEVLETEFNISVSVAVSRMAVGLKDISGAYQTCQDVFGYNSFLERDQQVSFYESLSDENQPIIHSVLTELDKKLISKLQLQDISGVKYVLHELIDREFIQSVPTVKIMRIRFGGICCKILDVLDELKNQIGHEMYYALDPAPRIAEAATLSELTAAMDEIFDAILRKQDEAREEPKPQWVDKMVTFIEEHYKDENLGLTEVSAAFGITPSYATRVFKQYTGRGIYETIQHVRLTAAKSLLYTDMTMKQIAETVGYTCFLSMNRAFKKYEGTTPSRFKGK